jgi:hypothetical protein
MAELLRKLDANCYVAVHLASTCITSAVHSSSMVTLSFQGVLWKDMISHPGFDLKNSVPIDRTVYLALNSPEAMLP